MARVYVSIGSNVDREENVSSAVQLLRNTFTAVQCSKVYESTAVGFEGDNFLNLVLAFDTDIAVGALNRMLHKVEDVHGRIRTNNKFSPRTLDIDILSYGDFCGNAEGLELPAEDILQYAFVLKPLAEVVGEELHPYTQQSYANLWQQFSGDKNALWPVDLPELSA